jgi:hypothetical protein
MGQSPRYSRRKLLYGLALGGAGLAIPAWTSPIAAAVGAEPLADVVRRVQTSVDRTGMSGWSAAVGSTFTIRDDDSSYAVRLVAVTPLRSRGVRPAGVRPGGFSLTFEGLNGPGFPAGDRTYVFQQANGSQVQLFVSAKSVVGRAGRLFAVLN